MTATGKQRDGDDRPTPVGAYSVTQPGTTRKREIPPPWIDCGHCNWRHYPSTSGGRWHIATRCMSCGRPIGDSQE